MATETVSLVEQQQRVLDEMQSLRNEMKTMRTDVRSVVTDYRILRQDFTSATLRLDSIEGKVGTLAEMFADRMSYVDAQLATVLAILRERKET